jgi:hypothetical protein
MLQGPQFMSYTGFVNQGQAMFLPQQANASPGTGLLANQLAYLHGLSAAQQAPHNQGHAGGLMMPVSQPAPAPINSNAGMNNALPDPQSSASNSNAPASSILEELHRVLNANSGGTPNNQVVHQDVTTQRFFRQH